MHIDDVASGVKVQHFKGGIYHVLCMAEASEDKGRRFVVYVPELSDTDAVEIARILSGRKVWARPAGASDCQRAGEKSFDGSERADGGCVVERFRPV